MGTVDLSLEISRLLCYGLQKGLLAPEDAAYSANRILALLGISEFEWKPVEEKLRFPAEPWNASAIGPRNRVLSIRTLWTGETCSIRK